MSEVLIVARTFLRGNAICLAGVDLGTGELVRLQDHEGRNFTQMAEFSVGSVWAMNYEPTDILQLPHSEDVKVVTNTSLVRSLEANDFNATLIGLNIIHEGPIESVLEGNLKIIQGGGAFENAVVEDPQNPGTRSLEIWKADHALVPLSSRRNGGRASFIVKLAGNDQKLKLPYSGTLSPPKSIPKGSILSLSLARWWRPNDAGPATPERCYLQICDLLT